jgi:hypothetical protein
MPLCWLLRQATMASKYGLNRYWSVLVRQFLGENGAPRSPVRAYSHGGAECQGETRELVHLFVVRTKPCFSVFPISSYIICAQII